MREEGRESKIAAGSGRYYLKQWTMDFSLCREKKWNGEISHNRSERKEDAKIWGLKDYYAREGIQEVGEVQFWPPKIECYWIFCYFYNLKNRKKEFFNNFTSNKRLCLWNIKDCACVVSGSVTSNSLWLHGLQPTRLLCPWDLQARILEWVVMPSSRGSSWPRDQIHVSCIDRWTLYH